MTEHGIRTYLYLKFPHWSGSTLFSLKIRISVTKIKLSRYQSKKKMATIREPIRCWTKLIIPKSTVASVMPVDRYKCDILWKISVNHTILRSWIAGTERYVQLLGAMLEMKWATTRQNQQNDCAPSEDSDQPGHPPSLIKVFAVHSMGS